MFSHIKAMEIADDATAIYEFSEILVNGVSPQIKVKIAGEANKAYFNALLKSQAAKTVSASRGKMSTKVLEENRIEDRELFPRYVIVDFVPGTVIDENGENVPFSVDVAEAFVKALPKNVFDRCRNFCASADNFQPNLSVEVGQKAKN